MFSFGLWSVVFFPKDTAFPTPCPCHFTVTFSTQFPWLRGSVWGLTTTLYLREGLVVHVIAGCLYPVLCRILLVQAFIGGYRYLHSKCAQWGRSVTLAFSLFLPPVLISSLQGTWSSLLLMSSLLKQSYLWDLCVTESKRSPFYMHLKALVGASLWIIFPFAFGFVSASISQQRTFQAPVVIEVWQSSLETLWLDRRHPGTQL